MTLSSACKDTSFRMSGNFRTSRYVWRILKKNYVSFKGLVGGATRWRRRQNRLDSAKKGSDSTDSPVYPPPTSITPPATHPEITLLSCRKSYLEFFQRPKASAPPRTRSRTRSDTWGGCGFTHDGVGEEREREKKAETDRHNQTLVLR